MCERTGTEHAQLCRERGPSPYFMEQISSCLKNNNTHVAGSVTEYVIECDGCCTDPRCCILTLQEIRNHYNPNYENLTLPAKTNRLLPIYYFQHLHKKLQYRSRILFSLFQTCLV